MPVRLPVAAALLCASTSAALAQQGLEDTQGLGGAAETSASSMSQLLENGYEIKATAPNGNRYVIFMQKEKSAYACEFVNVSTTRCRPIN